MEEEPVVFKQQEEPKKKITEKIVWLLKNHSRRVTLWK